MHGREALLEAEGVDPAVIRLVKYCITIEPSYHDGNDKRKEKKY